MQTYFWGIVFVTAVTAAYTAVGGIKAVVWTDLIQACLMCGAVVFAIFTILHHIPGGLAKVNEMLDGQKVAMFQTGWEATKPFGEAVRQMLENPYTILAALLGSTFLTMATHGTDQDMVQRMLTAEYQKKPIQPYPERICGYPDRAGFSQRGHSALGLLPTLPRPLAALRAQRNLRPLHHS
jgi:Na+/proline symporter